MRRFSTLPDFAFMADRFPRGRFCPLLIVLPRLKKRATGDPEGLFWRPRRQETPSRSVFGPFGRRLALRRRLPGPQSHQSVPARKSSTDHPRPTTSTAPASSTPAALTRSAIPTRECPGEHRLDRALVFPPAIGNAVPPHPYRTVSSLLPSLPAERRNVQPGQESADKRWPSHLPNGQSHILASPQIPRHDRGTGKPGCLLSGRPS